MLIAGPIAVTAMRDTPADMDLLYRWLNNEQVLAYLDGPGVSFTREQIEEKYGPRVRGEDYVIPCMIEYEATPIGYLQYYPLLEEERFEYEADPEGLHYGIDLFIGEPEYWNRGIGTTALRMITRYLFDVRQADSIYIDPAVWNIRAIRCYERSGFTIVKTLLARELSDGRYVDVLVMRMTGNDSKASGE
jgi:aminoglycoside 6'-N-acetyltransferase